MIELTIPAREWPILKKQEKKQDFDAESGRTQERDDKGRFEDEGKGSQEAGYEHPSEEVTHEKEPTGSTSGSIERSGDASARRSFRGFIQQAKAAQKYGWAVTAQPESFYEDPRTRIFLTKEGNAGAAVAPDGEATSLFKLPSSKANIDEILKPVMEAGNHANCFDTNGFLPNKYAKYGYRPVARVAFDDRPKVAPPDWKPEYGRPDVVFLVKDPDGVTGAPEINDDYERVKHQDPDSIPLVTYEKAIRIQKRAIAKVRMAEISELDSEKDLSNREKEWLRDFKSKQRAYEKETGKLGMRYDADLTSERVPEGQLTDFMSMMATHQRANLERLNKAGKNDEGWKFGGLDDYLLQNGREFEVPDKPPQIKLQTPRECYSNSANTMLNHSKDYNYVEGRYVSPHLPFPIDHAWLVDKKTGTVVDPTLGWQPKARYFGVEYPKMFVIKKMLQNKYYGIHSNGHTNNPVVLGIDKDMEYGKKRSA